MARADADSPVGQLFYTETDEQHSSDVVVIDLAYSPDKGITSLTLLTSVMDKDGEGRLILQQFTNGEKPSTLFLSADAMTLIAQEMNIIGERRVRALRRRKQQRTS